MFLDREDVFRVQAWALYERRRVSAKIEIIENRIRLLQFAGFIIGTEADQGEPQLGE